ncbi:8-oxoguanine DNA glycosylase OGG fold protein [Streptomyces collinus]
MIRSRALRARAGRCGQRYGGLPRGRQELRHSRGSPPGLRRWLPTPSPGTPGPPLHRGRPGQVSRAQVTSMVANTLARETLREALVATYVWGKGKSGSPGGSGPATLHKILAAEDLLDWRRG